MMPHPYFGNPYYIPRFLMARPEVVVLTSGGIDSCALCAYLKRERWDVYPLFVDYGQLGSAEEELAVRTFLQEINLNAKIVRVRNPELKIPMTGHGRQPQSTDEDFKETKDLDWVPHRNFVFLVLAAQYASLIGTRTLAIGSHKEEWWEQFPDSKRETLDQIAKALTLSEGKGKKWEILTPFVDRGWYKWDVVKWCAKNKLPLKYTYTCFKGRPKLKRKTEDVRKKLKHCGLCRGCYDRKAVFIRAKVSDPTMYEVE